MKTLLQKLPLDENASFISRTYKSPLYETPWHQHEEIELIHCVEGYGTLFAGDYIGDYNEGDIYLFGKNMPHWFRKKEELYGNALVIQFKEGLFGSPFLNLPELKKISKLLEKSKKGIKLEGILKEEVRSVLNIIEGQKGFEKLNSLLNALHHISVSKEYQYLNENYFENLGTKSQNKIGIIYEYSMLNFRENITLDQVAKLTNQSVPNFCKFFKKSTKKTYINFLNEIRIGHACELLKTTDLNITEICYESGFKNWSNFSTQFKKYCNISPKKYRLKYKLNI